MENDSKESKQTTRRSFLRKMGFIGGFGTGISQFSRSRAVAPPSSQFSNTYGGNNPDNGQAVVQTADNGYALAGSTTSYGSGEYDYWLVKIDSAGNIEWDRTFGGAGSESAFSLVQTTDGGYVLGGVSTSTPKRGTDLWLVKTDQNGNQVWEERYGSASDEGIESAGPRSLIQAQDGGYAIVGHTTALSSVGTTGWVVKTDSQGNMEWENTFGGNKNDFLRSIEQTSDGGYILGGYTRSVDPNVIDAWVVKIDPTGTEEWSKTFGTNPFNIGTTVIATQDGGYALTGSTGPANGLAPMLIKMGSSGDEEWSQMYPTGSRSWSIIQTLDGGFTMTGYTAGGPVDGWLLKTDENGVQQWVRIFGGDHSDYLYSIVSTWDNGYALAGRTESFGTGSTDFWLVKRPWTG